MGRSPCCDENGLKKGPWTTEEDEKLINYIKRHGHGSWRALPKLAGLNRCGKSCRLRWTNYLRPDIKRGKFSDEEEQIIINLHSVLGNKWSAIATHLPGRTDNEIKNFWNTHLRKKLLQMGIDPVTHRPRTDHLNLLANLPQLLAAATNLTNPIINPWDNVVMRSIQTDATQVAKFQLLQNIIQVLSNTTTTTSPANSIEALNLLGSLSNIHDQQGLGMNYFHQFGECIGNSTTSMNLGSTSQIISNSNVNEATQNYIQSILNSQVSDGHNNENYHQFSANVSAANSLPALVSFSPDQCSTVNQVGNKENPTHHHDQMSNPSSTSTTFEANWGELMEDEAGDSYWKEIIDQATSTPWPNS